MDTHKHIAAVIVTYEPDITALLDNVRQIAPQVARTFIVDNSVSIPAQAAVRALRGDGIEVDTVGGNVGIAEALNRGIHAAEAWGADHVLLLDQDSQAEDQMLAHLLHDLQTAQKRAQRIAAIGPTHLDARTGAPAPFVRFGFPLNRKQWPTPGTTVPCDFLITSGTLMPLDAYRQVGPFDQALFIDNVDMEWSHRAVAAGFGLLGSADAKMQHRLGDRLARRPGGYAAIHAPVRLYYMMRNRVHLYFRATTPGLWIAQDIPRLALKFVGFSLFVQPRVANARAMLGGIVDGIRGRLGVRSGSELREGSGDNLA